MADAAEPSALHKVLGRRRSDRQAWGILALMIIQFGYHETRVGVLERHDAERAAELAAVKSASDERRDALERTVSRLETQGDKQSDAIADLREIVSELRPGRRR